MPGTQTCKFPPDVLVYWYMKAKAQIGTSIIMIMCLLISTETGNSALCQKKCMAHDNCKPQSPPIICKAPTANHHRQGETSCHQMATHGGGMAND